MCGIVGYVGQAKALPVLLEGLKRLEYRGYDSAGIVLIEKNKAKSFKVVGRVGGLEKRIKSSQKESMGIAHTRWATHGKPSVKNSHPHCDCSGDIWVVHNGIIENYRKLKEKLEKKGHQFNSDTDTEVIAHLIEEFNKKLDFIEAISKALKIIKGTFGLIIASKKYPNKLIVAKRGSPVILGIGSNENIIASDASAIANYTKKVIYLEDDEMAEVFKDKYRVMDLSRKEKNKKAIELDWSNEEAQKGNFKHFMLKEIYEQPTIISNTIIGRVDKFLVGKNVPILGGLRGVENKLRKINKLIIVSCGTSYYAGLVGKYMLEEYAGISTEVECASEFRYRKPLLDKKTAVLAISQSGETADTLEAIREAKIKGVLTLGIINVVSSTIARETDAGIYTHAGPEIGVASTKAFVAQISALVLLTLTLGRQRQMSFVMGRRIAEEFKKIPSLIEQVLKQAEKIKKIAKKYQRFKDWLYLGRKYNYPIALEGALKLKEISYVHAEGYPVGEMKHGPIAMINKDFPCLFIVPNDSVYEKVVSGMEEIKSRSGKIVAIATKGDKKISKTADDVIYIPKTLEMLTPLLTVVVLQLLAYYIGVERKCDIDKPRNLAKSVTVE